MYLYWLTPPPQDKSGDYEQRGARGDTAQLSYAIRSKARIDQI